MQNKRYYPFTKVYHKWRSYDVWFLRYKARRTGFFVILGHFLPYDPPNNMKNQNFEKMKYTPGDIIIFILNLCTTNDDHMMYGSCVWQSEFFVTMDYFLPFYLPNNLENQIFLKNEKNAQRYYHFTHVYYKW